MDKSQLVELNCGHVYSRATWRADSTCWFCDDIQSGKNVSSKESRQYRHLLAAPRKKPGPALGFKRKISLKMKE